MLSYYLHLVICLVLFETGQTHYTVVLYISIILSELGWINSGSIIILSISFHFVYFMVHLLKKVRVI